ncbi:single-stranded DNA-binding protein [Adhaeribacter aerolatus]|uniref:Single-stranded DNA-binding protein n=1 Tax=Adhaeribacter aerolatus TaxID=670289 RepID=A0A512ATG1_9BACT|nr:single-stranded DNA-binding protein [Adhaeribacter aerolatus]GEO02970.1 single-stranded DNA-binding protein [Adhaeribacter aerolatus]
MASINRVILVGNLGKDPEIRHIEGGVAVARFPIATSETYKDKTGNKVERTEWHNIVVWRGLAEVAEKYLKKGQSVYIEGKIRTNNYQDKEGIQRYSVEIVADNMTMLSRAEGSNGQGQNNAQESSAVYNSGNPGKPEMSANYENEPDDLPF